jgi:hypothetical protein
LGLLTALINWGRVLIIFSLWDMCNLEFIKI